MVVMDLLMKDVEDCCSAVWRRQLEVVHMRSLSLGCMYGPQTPVEDGVQGKTCDNMHI